MAEPAHTRSKAIAAWLAVLAGVFGLHRMYLHGLADRWAWVQAACTGLGLLGLQRLQSLGQDDRLSWLLLPVLGLSIAAAMLAAIVYALTPDERWNQRFNAGREPSRTGWASVLAAIAALMIGGVALMGAIAYGGQKFFEWQLEESPAQAQKSSLLRP